MIELRKMKNKNFRTFGWVQDPSDFKSLFKVVSIFDDESEIYNNLVNGRINDLVEERDGKSHFLEELKRKPVKLKYSDLIGSSFIPRSSARCNGIVQATIKGQQRDFISDWPADNFIRWAQCLGIMIITNKIPVIIYFFEIPAVNSIHNNANTNAEPVP